MPKRISAIYQSHCPQLEKQHKIEIEYEELFFAGNLSPSYKKMGYNCDRSINCSHLDSYGRCPLLLQAPNDPFAC